MSALTLLQAEGAALRDMLKAARRLRADHPVVAGLHAMRDALPEEHRHHVDALLAQHGPVAKPARVPKAKPAVSPRAQQHIDAWHAANAAGDQVGALEAHQSALRADRTLTAADWRTIAHHTAGRGHQHFRSKGDAQKAIRSAVSRQRRLKGIDESVARTHRSGY